MYERGAWVMAQEVNRGFEVDIEGDGSKKELVRSTEHGEHGEHGAGFGVRDEDCNTISRCWRWCLWHVAINF